MDKNPSVEIYDVHREEIQAIFRSRLLTQILFALGAENRSLSDLREITGSSSQALIPRIRHLEAAGYVEHVAGDYALTPIGLVLEPAIERVVRLIGVITEHREFWTGHDIESIPPDFLEDLGDLYAARVVRSVDEDLLQVYRNFVRMLDGAAWLNAVTSVTNPAFAEVIARMAMQGKPVDLVVSHELAEKLAAEPFAGMLGRLSEVPTFSVSVSALPVRFGLSVTDTFVSLGLYGKAAGVYDAGTDLFGTGRSAVEWGERLFRYYRQDAEKLRFAP
jgi:predicted transcriptional regulator